MNTRTLYRIASVVFVFFAAGHTFGFLSFKPPTPEGVAALSAMNNTYFTAGGSTLSLGGFYLGFGLSATVNLLFSVLVAWQLGEMSEAPSKAAARIAWGFFAVQIGGFALSCLYFSLPPQVLSAAVAVLLGWAAWKFNSAVAHR